MGSADSQTRLENELVAIRDVPEPLRYGNLLRSLEQRLFDEATTHAPRVGRYELREILGKGGCGIVYRAWDPELEREVALKLLVLSRDARQGIDPTKALLHEARAAARLAHPAIVGVYDFGTFEPESLWVGDGPDMRDTGCAYVVMELIAGETLREWQKGEHGWREIVRVFVSAGRGLAAAHGAGVVHHDFKPANVMVSPDGRARVLDFGLAGLVEVASGRVDPGPTGGTPAYMAPEQHGGERGDARSDQYAFCVALWEALSGRRPFAGQGIDALARAKQAGPPKAPTDAVAPRALFKLLDRGMSAASGERFETMSELLGELEKVLRRRWIMVGGAFAAGCLGLGIAAGVAATQGTGTAELACDTGSDRAFAEVWNDARAAAVDEAFAATGLGYAPDAARSVRDRMESYRHDWVATFEGVCAAEDEDPERVRAALDCLDDRRHMVASLLDVFTEGRPTTVQRAVGAVDAVPGPSECAGTASREQRYSQRFSGELGRGWAAFAAGQYEEVIEMAQRYREPSGPGSRARWGFLVGSAHIRYGDEEAARAALRDALLDATQAGDTDLEARVLVALANLDLIGGDPEHAAERLELARAKHDQVPSRDLDALITQQEAGLALGIGDHAEFEEYAGRFLELEPESNRALQMRMHLAASRARRGRNDDAIELFRTVLADRIAALGEEHPDVAYTRVHLGGGLLAAGRPEDALEQFQAALDIYDGVTGPEQHGRLVALLNTSLALLTLGRPLSALEPAREGFALTRGTLESGHVMAANAAYAFAEVLFLLGRPREALPVVRALHAARTASFGPEHPQTQAAAAMLDRARLEAGEVHGRGPVVRLEEIEAAEDRLRWLGSRARSFAHDGSVEAARAEISRLRAQVEGVDELTASVRAEGWIAYAEVEELVGEHEAALEALDRAGDLEAFPTKAALAATIRTRALLDLGRTDEARESAALASTRATEARLEGPAVAAVHLARASALAESDPGESAKARRAAARAFEAAGTETSVIERIQAAS